MTTMLAQDGAAMPSFGVILITVPTIEVGQTLARALIEARLAACVTIFPVQSIYTWQGEVSQDAEFQLLIKSDLRLFDPLEEMVRSLHPYEVPEVIALPIVAGSQPYFNWMGEHL
ncbi:MAG: divalent-cation tolerance protein CutA [Synechococcales bacterium]|nr:divalent-cation tolerance protein CutA [Synechococcales bacterium]